MLVVENDEHAHAKYDPVKEQRRMQLLQRAFGQPTHFVRFNPVGDKDALLCYISPILTHPQAFFAQNPGLSVHYMYY